MKMESLMQYHTRLTASHFTLNPKGSHVALEDGSLRKLSLLERLTGNCGNGVRYEEVKGDRRVELNRVVTDVFVAELVDGLQSAEYINLWKYHDSGTGVGAEAAGDTALGTPCGESRDAGSQVEGATANIYKSVATHTYAGTFSITEHGLFSASTGGILMDRTKFTAIGVDANDKIEFTFEITFSAGG